MDVQFEGLSSVQFSKEKNTLAFLDVDDKVLLEYAAPVARQGKSTSSVPIAWDPSKFELTIDLFGFAYPLSVLFGIQTRPTDGGSRGFGFGFGFGLGPGQPKSDTLDSSDSESYSDSDQDDKTKKRSTQIGFKFPSLHFGGKWTKFLYGSKDISAAGRVPVGEAAVLNPSLGRLSLSVDGALLLAADSYSLEMTPFGISLTEGDLYQAEQFAVLRSPAGEVGVSFDKAGAKYFFCVEKTLATPSISLKLKV